MRFFPNRTKRVATQDRKSADANDGVPSIEAVIAEAIAATTGKIRPMDLLTSSYVDLRDWRMHVVGLRDRTKAAQESRGADLSTFQDIKLAREGLDMQIEEFDLATSKLAASDPGLVAAIDALRAGFKSLRAAVDRLHDMLQADGQ